MINIASSLQFSFCRGHPIHRPFLTHQLACLVEEVLRRKDGRELWVGGRVDLSLRSTRSKGAWEREMPRPNLLGCFLAKLIPFAPAHQRKTLVSRKPPHNLSPISRRPPTPRRHCHQNTTRLKSRCRQITFLPRLHLWLGGEGTKKKTPTRLRETLCKCQGRKTQRYDSSLTILSVCWLLFCFSFHSFFVCQ